MRLGGLTSDADITNVNLAYKVDDGQKIYIPNKAESSDIKNIVTKENGEGIVQEVRILNKVNINTATQTELETLSGIGPSTALKIITYRSQNGKFKTIEDIKNVPGIGESKFKQIENEITI